MTAAGGSDAPPDARVLLACAKLNLSLRVLAREAGGYHQIETVFCLIELADEVEVRTGGADVSLEILAPPEQSSAPPDLGPTDANLAYRAAVLFRARTHTAGGARIRLVKRVPDGAGLGGGSSDAAAVLKALNDLHDAPLTRAQLIELGSELGSDVPFFLTGAGLAFAWGRGSRLTALPALPAKPVLLALSEQRVATAAAYAALAAVRGDTYVTPAGTIRLWPACWGDLVSGAVNDFEPVVFERLPRLAAVRAALERHGARVARLTGTGSAVFGLYDDTATLAAARAELAGEFPDTRFVATATVSI